GRDGQVAECGGAHAGSPFRSSALKDQVQAVQPADVPEMPLHRPAGVERVAGHPRVDLLHRHAKLHTGQVRARAPVNAAAEPEVAVRGPAGNKSRASPEPLPRAPPPPPHTPPPPPPPP